MCQCSRVYVRTGILKNFSTKITLHLEVTEEICLYFSLQYGRGVTVISSSVVKQCFTTNFVWKCGMELTVATKQMLLRY